MEGCLSDILRVDNKNHIWALFPFLSNNDYTCSMKCMWSKISIKLCPYRLTIFIDIHSFAPVLNFICDRNMIPFYFFFEEWVLNMNVNNMSIVACNPHYQVMSNRGAECASPGLWLLQPASANEQTNKCHQEWKNEFKLYSDIWQE